MKQVIFQLPSSVKHAYINPWFRFLYIALPIILPAAAFLAGFNEILLTLLLALIGAAFPDLLIKLLFKLYPEPVSNLIELDDGKLTFNLEESHQIGTPEICKTDFQGSIWPLFGTTIFIKKKSGEEQIIKTAIANREFLQTVRDLPCQGASS